MNLIPFLSIVFLQPNLLWIQIVFTIYKILLMFIVDLVLFFDMLLCNLTYINGQKFIICINYRLDLDHN